jgi:hypothetical protein
VKQEVLPHLKFLTYHFPFEREPMIVEVKNLRDLKTCLLQDLFIPAKIPRNL